MKIWYLHNAVLRSEEGDKTRFDYDPENWPELNMIDSLFIRHKAIDLRWLKEVHAVIGDVIREVEGAPRS